MPCLNEAETVATCVRKAVQFIADSGIGGEVVVADNGSTDGSQAARRGRGRPRGRPWPSAGYGNALMGGILAARGEYVIMGDADDSYDFTQPDAVRDRAAQGRRPGDGQPLQGRHRARRHAAAAPLPRQPGALLHRPAVLPLRDRRLPLRPARLPAGQRDRARPAGHRHGVRQRDGRQGHPRASRRSPRSPPRSAKDGRSRPPHLRSWRDGWRHLRFLLLFSPRWLFFLPGLVLLLVGLGLGAAVAAGPLTHRRRLASTWTRWSPAARASTSASRPCCSGCSPRSTPERRDSCPTEPKVQTPARQALPGARPADRRGGRASRASSAWSSRSPTGGRTPSAT